MFSIEGRHCESSSPRPWPTYWRSRIWNINISETVRASAKKNNHGMSFKFLIFAIEWCNCENCSSWTWPTFWRSQIKNCNISDKERWHKNLWEWFIDFDICHRMVSLWKLYSVTLTYFVNVKKRKCLYLKRWELAKNVWWSFFSFWHLPWNCVCENCTPWPWPTIWR